MSARHVSARQWAAAGVPLLLAGLVSGAMLLSTDTSAVAGVSGAADRPAAVPVAAGMQAAAPTTVQQGKRTVTVDPVSKVSDSQAAITVTGKGFDPSKTVWVAICRADGTAPKDLSQCLGGAIPDKNSTTSWGVVTSRSKDVPPGPVPTGWVGNTFSLTLQVQSAKDNIDCSSQKCAVYVRDAASAGPDAVGVPLAFAPAVATTPTTTSATTATTTTPTTPTTSSPPPTTTAPTSPTPAPTKTTASTTSSPPPTTSSSPSPVPTTVQAVSLLLPNVEQDREQIAVFTGFRRGEVVSVSLSGNRVKLPNSRADDNGGVRISFTVPKDLPVGGYTLRVEGQTSLRVGEAGFTVIAVTAASSASTTSAPPPSSSVPSVVTSASVVASTLGSASAGAIGVPSPIASTAGSVAISSSTIGTPVSTTSSNTPWWLWITLAAVLLVGLVVAAVAMGRRHRQETDAERDLREAELADAAQVQALRHPAQTPPAVPPAGAGFDEHPDRPILFSHRQAEDYVPPATPGDPDAPTRAIDPTSSAPDAPGRHSPLESPGTQQFNPFADDTSVPSSSPTGGPGTQQFNPFADGETDPPDSTKPGEHSDTATTSAPDTDADADTGSGGTTGHSDGTRHTDGTDHTDSTDQWRPPPPA